MIFFKDLDIAKKYKQFFSDKLIDCDIALSVQDASAKAMLFNYSFYLIDKDLALIGEDLSLMDLVTSSHSSSKIIIFADNVTNEDEKVFYVKGASLIQNYSETIENVYKKVNSLLSLSNRDDFFVFSDLSLDRDRRLVLRGDKEIFLRNKEFNLLEYLMRNVGKVLSRDQILDNVWDREADIFTNTVDVHIHILRKKIDEGFEKKIIQTIPCIGYKLDIC
ncbi:winged helix-turn-helix domain-containing protein [Patescibacteria group bacterium]|nr:winged helix-turn-helix domain-containing protein [Patescibacteria group bacterium]